MPETTPARRVTKKMRKAAAIFAGILSEPFVILRRADGQLVGWPQKTVAVDFHGEKVTVLEVIMPGAR